MTRALPGALAVRFLSAAFPELADRLALAIQLVVRASARELAFMELVLLQFVAPHAPKLFQARDLEAIHDVGIEGTCSNCRGGGGGGGGGARLLLKKEVPVEPFAVVSFQRQMIVVLRERRVVTGLPSNGVYFLDNIIAVMSRPRESRVSRALAVNVVDNVRVEEGEGQNL